MPRRKKVEIELSNEAYKKLLQEIYSDSFEINNRLIKKYKQQEKIIDDKETDDEKIMSLNAFGKQQNELLKLMQENNKVKLEIAKMVSNNMGEDKEDGENDNNVKLNMNDMKSIRDMLKNGNDFLEEDE